MHWVKIRLQMSIRKLIKTRSRRHWRQWKTKMEARAKAKRFQLRFKRWKNQRYKRKQYKLFLCNKSRQTRQLRCSNRQVWLNQRPLQMQQVILKLQICSQEQPVKSKSSLTLKWPQSQNWWILHQVKKTNKKKKLIKNKKNSLQKSKTQKHNL